MSYEINTHKFVIFVNDCNERFKEEMKKNIHFQLQLKQISQNKYSQGCKELMYGNYKTVQTEIKDLIKGKTLHAHGLEG